MRMMMRDGIGGLHIFSNSGGMEMIRRTDISRARRILHGVIHHTKLDYSHTFSRLSGNEVYLKTENTQRTGSFKIRGAYNLISALSEEEGRNGVVAASAGNHAQGVAYAAAAVGIDSTIVMPEGTPISKVSATRGYGAEVVLHGSGYDESYARARQIQEETGATFVHAFDDERIIAGQGTIGLEILEDLAQVDAVVVPIGGGGLISGIGLAIKETNPRVRIIGVEAEGAASVTRSLAAGEVVALEGANTIADGISVKRPGEITFPLIQRYVDEVVTVNDEEIASSVLLGLERAKMVTEGAGAVALAAMLFEKTDLRDKVVVSILSGGNIDVNFVSRIIEQGLMKSGRRVALGTVIPDRPGHLQSFLRIVAEQGANVLTISQDRLDVRVPLDKVEVQVVLETQGSAHVGRIVEALREADYGVTVAS